MRLIIDSNIIFAALIRNSTARRILASDISFCAPDTMLREIRKHTEEILQKSGLDAENFELLLTLFMESIEIVPREGYASSVDEALRILGKEHIGDIPFLALAFAIENDGIWTNDKDFERQNKAKVWKTKDLVAHLGIR